MTTQDCDIVNTRSAHVVRPTLDLFDLSPEAAVQAASAAHRAGDQDAWRRLDTNLRGRVLALLLLQRGDQAALERALGEAIDVGLVEAGSTWEARWEALLDVLVQGMSIPTLARGLAALQPDGLAGRILQALAQGHTPIRPHELATLLLPEQDEDSSRTQISRALGVLAEAGLVERRRLGKAVWVSLLPLGAEAAGLRVPKEPEPEPEGERWWSEPFNTLEVSI